MEIISNDVAFSMDPLACAWASHTTLKTKLINLLMNEAFSKWVTLIHLLLVQGRTLVGQSVNQVSHTCQMWSAFVMSYCPLARSCKNSVPPGERLSGWLLQWQSHRSDSNPANENAAASSEGKMLFWAPMILLSKVRQVVTSWGSFWKWQAVCVIVISIISGPPEA